LHDERERDGDGTCHLPFNRRVARRTVVGREQQASRSDVHFHVAGRRESGVMTTADHIVFIVDDDARIRESLTELLDAHGIRSVAYGSAGEYVGAENPDLPAILILDVELPNINGLDLQKQIAEGSHPPIVFITGYGDIPSSVRAIKRGAVDFLTKP